MKICALDGCSGVVPAGSWNRKFCSQECGQSYNQAQTKLRWRERAGWNVLHVCKFDGCTNEVNLPQVKFCSKDCKRLAYNQAQNKRNRERAGWNVLRVCKLDECTNEVNLPQITFCSKECKRLATNQSNRKTVITDKVCEWENCNNGVVAPRLKFCSEECMWLSLKKNNKQVTTLEQKKCYAKRERDNRHKMTPNDRKKERAQKQAYRESWTSEERKRKNAQRENSKQKLRSTWTEDEWKACRETENARYASFSAEERADIYERGRKRLKNLSPELRQRHREATWRAHRNRRISKNECYSIQFNSTDVLERDLYLCQECGIQTVPGGRGRSRTTLDHIYPASEGGPDAPANLRCLCVSCNSSKGAKMPSMIVFFSPDNTGHILTPTHFKQYVEDGGEVVEAPKVYLDNAMS